MKAVLLCEWIYCLYSILELPIICQTQIQALGKSFIHSRLLHLMRTSVVLDFRTIFQVEFHSVTGELGADGRANVRGPRTGTGS